MSYGERQKKRVDFVLNHDAKKKPSRKVISTLSEAIRMNTMCFDASCGKLNLVGCGIKTLDSIQDRRILVGTTQLFLSTNELTSLKGLELFSQCSLKALSLSRNQIQRIEDIQRLRSLKPTLQVLNLENNPVTSMPFYRYHVIHAVGHNLRTLDQCDVTPSERTNAPDVIRKEQAFVQAITNLQHLHTMLCSIKNRFFLHKEMRRRSRYFLRASQPRLQLKVMLKTLAPIFRSLHSNVGIADQIRKIVWNCGIVRNVVQGNSTLSMKDEDWFSSFANTLSNLHHSSMELWIELQDILQCSESFDDLSMFWNREMKFIDESDQVTAPEPKTIPPKETSRMASPCKKPKKKMVENVVNTHYSTPVSGHCSHNPPHCHTRVRPCPTTPTRPTAPVLEEETSLNRLQKETLSLIEDVPAPSCAPSPVLERPREEEKPILQYLQTVETEKQNMEAGYALLQRTVLQQHAQILFLQRQVDHLQYEQQNPRKRSSQDLRKWLCAVEHHEHKILRRTFRNFRSAVWINSRHAAGSNKLSMVIGKNLMKKVWVEWKAVARSTKTSENRLIRQMLLRRTFTAMTKKVQEAQVPMLWTLNLSAVVFRRWKFLVKVAVMGQQSLLRRTMKSWKQNVKESCAQSNEKLLQVHQSQNEKLLCKFVQRWWMRCEIQRKHRSIETVFETKLKACVFSKWRCRRLKLQSIRLSYFTLWRDETVKKLLHIKFVKEHQATTNAADVKDIWNRMQALKQKLDKREL